MAFGQIYKKRGPGGGNTGNSDLETSEEKTEIPDSDGIMSQIDRKLSETKNIAVREEEQTMSRGCGC